MTSIGVLQIAIFLRADPRSALKPLGAYMARVFEGQRTFLHPVLRWLEVLTYKVTGSSRRRRAALDHYTASLLSFSIFGFLLMYLSSARRASCRSTRSISERAQCHAGPGVQHRHQLRHATRTGRPMAASRRSATSSRWPR